MATLNAKIERKEKLTRYILGRASPHGNRLHPDLKSICLTQHLNSWRKECLKHPTSLPEECACSSSLFKVSE